MQGKYGAVPGWGSLQHLCRWPSHGCNSQQILQSASAASTQQQAHHTSKTPHSLALLYMGLQVPQPCWLHFGSLTISMLCTDCATPYYNNTSLKDGNACMLAAWRCLLWCCAPSPRCSAYNLQGSAAGAPITIRPTERLSTRTFDEACFVDRTSRVCASLAHVEFWLLRVASLSYAYRINAVCRWLTYSCGLKRS